MSAKLLRSLDFMTQRVGMARVGFYFEYWCCFSVCVAKADLRVEDASLKVLST